MKQHKLVLASVLKPVNETRMYEKFGLSLDQTSKYEINIIGFYSKNLPSNNNITFHPIFHFPRISVKRIFKSYLYLKKLYQIKPEIIIISTHELLLPTTIFKILFGCKVVYDIQENHFRNILYTKHFPKLIRPLLAGYVRAKEYLTSPLVDHYFLAEKEYENELHFGRQKRTVLENKYLPISANKTTHFSHENPSENLSKTEDVSPTKMGPKNRDEIQLIFSGTLAESTGVFDAIELAKSLHNIEPKVQLEIIGYSPVPDIVKRLKSAAQNHPFTTLIGGDELVPHHVILDHISKADFGIVFYPANKSTVNSIPTKIYEYLGCTLPILLQPHPKWVELCERYSAHLVFTPNKTSPNDLMKAMKSSSFYVTTPGDEILWKSEENKLIKMIDSIIHK
ncbi:glycosyltransferase [Fulvivirga ligni]|uniref:glycosyltransferase n=1 Tax=Fulvivirga ligni TaxID=2904246 RepID=UPI001F47F784|nr:glycosyltransferase [Fulvivirga ligni]UII24056.1 glycosyltransferase [Fulvivirga ligni]